MHSFSNPPEGFEPDKQPEALMHIDSHQVQGYLQAFGQIAIASSQNGQSPTAVLVHEVATMMTACAIIARGLPSSVSDRELWDEFAKTAWDTSGHEAFAEIIRKSPRSQL